MQKTLIIQNTTQDLLRLSPDEIMYIKSDGNYSQLWLYGHDDSVQLWMSLTAISDSIKVQMQGVVRMFVRIGKQLARGTGRVGFVAVTKNGWQMGVSQEDSVKEYVISQGGSMFRQFALVSAGQICLKQFALKGKVHRRSLARKPGEATAYYVETVNKESLYDFAEALADYGFIDAVYLTGADGTEPIYRDAYGVFHGNVKSWKLKSNLLVFRHY